MLPVDYLLFIKWWAKKRLLKNYTQKSILVIIIEPLLLTRS